MENLEWLFFWGWAMFTSFYINGRLDEIEEKLDALIEAKASKTKLGDKADN